MSIEIIEEYIGFVYCWENIENGKKYIGSHLGKIDDGYTGSGKYFCRAYEKNPEKFKRVILEYVPRGDRKDVLTAEQRHLDTIDNIGKNENFYNISPFAGGGYNLGHLTEEQLKETWDKSLLKRKVWRESLTAEETEAIADKKRTSWTEEKRKKHSENTTLRRIEEESNKTEEDHKKHEDATRNGILEIKETNPEKWEEWQDNKSKSVKNYWDNVSEEDKKTRFANRSETVSKLKIKWINKNGIIKGIPSANIQSYLDDGWNLGRK
jgi:hypothetical protein